MGRRMPKLLQINVTANWGSTGKIAEAIGNAAIAHGWESYIAYGRWSNPSQSNLIKIGGHWDKYFHFAEQTICDNEGLCSRKATKVLIEQIKEISPNVVQLHNIHDHYLNYCLLFEYLNQTKIKVVWTFHDCWAFTGHCFHFVTADCERWKTGCHDCPMKNVLPKTFVDCSRKNYELKRQLFWDCKNLTIVACSDWMAGFVRQSFLKDKPITVIKNGVDLKVFRPVEGRKDTGRTHVLAVSSVWNKEKGIDDILHLRILLPEDVDITIIGLTQKQIAALPSGIKGIARTQNVEELVGYYSTADVLINPTYADTFPTVNLEALACGTPVITYRTGGSPEAVTPETGWVVEQGDVEGVTRLIQEFKEFKSSRRLRMREACRQRAEEYFDKDMCFEKYVELYERLVNQQYNQQ